MAACQTNPGMPKPLRQVPRARITDSPWARLNMPLKWSWSIGLSMLRLLLMWVSP